MGDFELDLDLVKKIKNSAIVMEMMNLQRPQDRRTQPSEMLKRQIQMLKSKLHILKKEYFIKSYV